MAATTKSSAILLAVLCFHQISADNKGETTFCCDVELKDISVDVVKMKPVKKSRWEEREVIVGYKDCGIVGQSVCPIYDSKWDEIVYYTSEAVVEKETYSMPCPNDHVVCCEGYEKYQDNCYKPDEIVELKKLEALGILG